MTLGERIKLKREEKGMSQLDLAKKVGYGTRSAISMIEADKRDLPLAKVREIAKVLEVSPDWLMGWADISIKVKTDLDLTVEALNNLTPQQLKRVRSYIEFLKFQGEEDEPEIEVNVHDLDVGKEVIDFEDSKSN